MANGMMRTPEGLANFISHIGELKPLMTKEEFTRLFIVDSDTYEIVSDKIDEAFALLGETSELMGEALSKSHEMEDKAGHN